MYGDVMGGIGSTQACRVFTVEFKILNSKLLNIVEFKLAYSNMYSLVSILLVGYISMFLCFVQDCFVQENLRSG